MVVEVQTTRRYKLTPNIIHETYISCHLIILAGRQVRLALAHSRLLSLELLQVRELAFRPTPVFVVSEGVKDIELAGVKYSYSKFGNLKAHSLAIEVQCLQPFFSRLPPTIAAGRGRVFSQTRRVQTQNFNRARSGSTKETYCGNHSSELVLQLTCM